MGRGEGRPAIAAGLGPAVRLFAAQAQARGCAPRTMRGAAAHAL